MTPVAMALMAGLDEGTVEYKPTYNGEDEEPEVFPGLFPNLLANGASGIAVKLVEFNKNKEVLWATSDGLGHGIHHFQILTTNGVALPLDAVK